QDPSSNLVHDATTLTEAREWERAPLAAGMLERVEHPGHLDELDGALEVASEPELLEMGDVSQIPQDRAHQRIVLAPQILIAQRGDQEHGPRSGLEQLPGDSLRVDARGGRDSRHGSFLTRSCLA